MKVSVRNRKIITDEFKYVAKQIRKEKQLNRKSYYFSAAYGVVNRIFNIEFDPTLVFIHHILQSAHSLINTTVDRISTGQETTIQISEVHFEGLAEALETLSDKIDKDKDVGPTLQKISNIAYSATGNGYYLCQKGMLKI